MHEDEEKNHFLPRPPLSALPPLSLLPYLPSPSSPPPSQITINCFCLSSLSLPFSACRVLESVRCGGSGRHNGAFCCRVFRFFFSSGIARRPCDKGGYETLGEGRKAVVVSETSKQEEKSEIGKRCIYKAGGKIKQ